MTSGAGGSSGTAVNHTVVFKDLGVAGSRLVEPMKQGSRCEKLRLITRAVPMTTELQGLKLHTLEDGVLRGAF